MKRIGRIGFFLFLFFFIPQFPLGAAEGMAPFGVMPKRALETEKHKEIIEILKEYSYYIHTENRYQEFVSCFSKRSDISVDSGLKLCIPEDRKIHHYTSQEIMDILKDIPKGAGSGYIGAVLYFHDVAEKGAVIKTVIPGGPLAELGMFQRGDVITHIAEGNGPFISIVGVSNSRIINMLRGEVGTKVHFTISRRGIALGTFTITRRIVPFDGIVEKTYYADDLVGYMEIGDIDALKVSAFESRLRSLQDRKAKWIILDLRDNSGGNVGKTVEALKMILPANKKPFFTVYRKKGNKISSTTVMYRVEEEKFSNFRFVVLVNEDTASAAEIIAGALKREGAIMIGRNTYGKMSLQRSPLLPGGGMLVLTIGVGYFYDGTTAEKNPIIPDIIVKEDEDPIERALEYIRVH